jgi:hypothetical protein
MKEELPLDDKPRWTVEPVFQRETKKMRERKIKPELKHYELRYNGTRQDKATGEAEVARLRETARFCNTRGLASNALPTHRTRTNTSAIKCPPPPAEILNLEP